MSLRVMIWSGFAALARWRAEPTRDSDLSAATCSLTVDPSPVFMLAFMLSMFSWPDLPPFWAHRDALVRRQTELEEQAHALAGAPFSLTNPAEVGTVLFRTLRLAKPPCATEGRSGAPPSTAVQSTAELQLNLTNSRLCTT